MTPRRTIGEDPLDALIPVQAPPPEESKKPRPSSTRPKTPREKAAPPVAPEPTRPAGKERLTVHLPTEVIDRARNAVFWSPGLTLAGLAERAFLEALERLEKKNGGPFAPRKAELKGGRPVK